MVFKRWTRKTCVRLRWIRSGLPAACGRLRGLASAVLEAGLDLLAPGFCRECGRALPGGREGFCPGCLQAIEWIGPACARCGTPVLSPPPFSRERLLVELPPRCGSCAGVRLWFDLASAAGKYTGALRTAILRHKFHGDASVSPLLQAALGRALTAPAVAAVLPAAEALVPVPLHALKRWWRRRDHALALAASLQVEVANSTGRTVPILRTLVKRRWTPSQVRLRREERRRSPRGAFDVRKGSPVPACVLLVDDVLTTGATASECARALKRRGAKRVVVLAVARS